MKNQNLLLCEKHDRAFYGREKQARSHFHIPQCDRFFLFSRVRAIAFGGIFSRSAMLFL
ncbi:hypothetical protein [Spirulina sp. 06S082]|uniref:hypothetical protein n=1 Tax=Spirulina sp. 06S082 TaxID=3110248 RepID=UPI002B1FB45C|nr:hypothetical protein [Spirulina sp. 06S082]MEA5469066.1 hypothetical protein [Spirulina sp. 06S082]